MRQGYPRAYARLVEEQGKISCGISDLKPDRGDHRFEDEAWRSNSLYRSSMQYYLAYCRFMREWLEEIQAEGLERDRARFHLDNMLASMSPTNNPWTNPAALKRALETGGESLFKGFNNYLRDLRDNQGMPSQVDMSRFEVGRDVATTAGAVVYRSEMFELIQYDATTPEVYERPLLVCTSMVNKYYLSDLTAERSLYRHVLEGGMQVFVIVWRNPTPAESDWSFGDYVDALLEAAEVVARIAKQETINLAGFCAGAYLSLTLLAYLAASGRQLVDTHTVLLNVVLGRPDDSIFSTLSTPESIRDAKQRARAQGVITADELTMGFNMVQPDKLIWPYHVQNYLMGEDPEDSEVMFWMNDQVNLPATLYGELLKLSHYNQLAEGEITFRDEPIDLAAIETETLILGALKDHVCPWDAVYRTRTLLGGRTTYLLSGAGHVTPMITPADDPREHYFTNPDTTPEAEEWITGATRHDGSWRDAWLEWLSARSGEVVSAPRKPGSRKYPPLDPAPGTYVRG